MSARPPHPHSPDPFADLAALARIAVVEHDLRVASLELWVAGWMPHELIDHVRRSVPDPRAADLVGWAVLVDDSLRDEQARPAEWREAVDRLRAAIGVRRHDLVPGWVARWIRANSTLETSDSIARVLVDLFATLHDLVAPSPSAA